MMSLTVDEVRAIREKISLKTSKMTSKELKTYYARSTEKFEQRISKIRKDKGIVFASAKH